MAQQEIGDREALRRRIEAWLQRTHPQRSGLRLGPLSFPEASGESSVTLLTEALWDGGGEKLVVRMVPPTNEVFDSHDLRMQVDMMRLMRREGLPVPEVLGHESDESVIGREFYVMAFVEGRIPPDNPPMAFGSWVTDDLDEAGRAAMWDSGLRVLAAIHAIDPDRPEAARLPTANPGEPLVEPDLRRFDVMFRPELRERCDPIVLEAWEFLRANPPCDGERRICWGDARVGNVIWRGVEPVAVLDWEMANLGDPRADVAWWMWIDKCTTEGLGMPMMTGVPEPAEAYRRWSELTGYTIEGMSYFELFTAVRYAIILERKFDQMRQRNPDMPEIPNFAAGFVEKLLTSAQLEKRDT